MQTQGRLCPPRRPGRPLAPSEASNRFVASAAAAMSTRLAELSDEDGLTAVVVFVQGLLDDGQVRPPPSA